MNIRRWSVALLVAMLATAAAIAQDGAPPAGEGRGGRGFRGGRAGPGAPGGKMELMRYLRTVESFEQEITRGLADEQGKTDEELTSVIHDIFNEQLAPLREQAAKGNENRQDNAEQMRDLMKQIREAQQAGDQDKVRQLREQMQALRSKSTPDYQPIHEALFKELRGELEGDEIPKFDAMVERFETRLGPPEGQADDVRRVRQALASLNLTPEQRTRVREIITEHRKAASEPGPGGPAAAGRAKARAQELREKIAAELDEQQAQQFEKAIGEAENQAASAAAEPPPPPNGQHPAPPPAKAPAAGVRKPAPPAPAPADEEPAPADDSGAEPPE